MNPFKALASAIAAHIVKFRNEVNDKLKNAGPLEQIEAGEVAKDLLRTLKWSKEDAERLSQAYDLTESALNKMFDDTKAEIETAALSAALTAGTHIKKEDHDNLLAAAKDAGKAEAQAEFAEMGRKAALAAERRAKVVEKVGEIAAAAFTDGMLADDKWEESVTAAEGRIARLKELNISAENFPAAFRSLATIPLTAEGSADFEARVPTYAEMAARLPAAPAAPTTSTTATGPKRPATPAVPTGSADGKKKFLA